ncbi:MAG: histidine kinase [Oceanospirillaceae bacterium]|nr:histidine kinase [Oceanospirillaceae bacterium]
MTATKKPFSIQQTLRRQWLLSLLAITLPLMWLADLGVRQISTQYVVSRLQHDSETLIAALQRNPESGVWQLPASLNSGLYERVYSGHYYAISRAGQVLLSSRSLWDYPPPSPDVRSGSQRHWHDRGVNGQEWLNLAQGTELEGDALTVWVAEDISALHDQLMTFRLSATGLLILALATLGLIQRQVIRRAFLSLGPLQQQLEALRFGERERLETEDSIPAELQPLAQETDRLLNLLQERATRNRHAIGNLAHEMKRPLQRLLLLADELPEAQQQTLLPALNQLQELTARELRRARIVGMAAPGRHFRPAEDLPGLLSVLQKIYPDVRITADYPADAILPCDRDDLLEVLGNLLDNACKYGGDNVACDITTTEEFWQLSVCDNGPGIAAARQAQILQRGIRLDEQGIDGSGLGLAMVGDIVRSYGGHLKLSNHQHGGLLVRVQLPAQAEVRTCDQRVLQHSPGRPW